MDSNGRVTSYCTCPVGGWCKHIREVAMAMYHRLQSIPLSRLSPKQKYREQLQRLTKDQLIDRLVEKAFPINVDAEDDEEDDEEDEDEDDDEDDDYDDEQQSYDDNDDQEDSDEDDEDAFPEEEEDQEHRGYKRSRK
ncbi:hypothetical protein DFA_03921 [Cavenderia fasciculata]|uniref:SWIM-type domain-containing protein n=1 Tax=Cavenderia fasciculata TaxID=261658 RepID=F4Q0S6_CACFS|nr:uncharacterized protein DFA_03921 [Cavenderia fasciculata]EGG18427.1 hypothetical protein DFA_03921 [Cavenderia fasciculata]|eukprot:XP_004366331.1 hypothetical protein DFA_03921 [Cavenderia fasciculata]